MAGVDSGIKLHPDTVKAIEELQGAKKAGDPDALECITMRIGKAPGEGVQKVLLEKKLYKKDCDAAADGVTLKDGETSVWYTFRKALAEHNIAYGAAFCEYLTSSDKRSASKLVFVTWNSDNAPMKEKMVYSSTKVFNKMQSGTINHQASDDDDMSYLNIVKKIERK